MAKKIIVGNWKMNLDFQTAKEFVLKLDQSAKIKNYHAGLCVNYLWLKHLAPLCKKIKLYAQNCSGFEVGAYTSQVSLNMLTNIKINHVLLGHSEARKFLYENDLILNRKLKLALAKKFKIIFCIGENLSQHEQQKSLEVIRSQIWDAFVNLEISKSSDIIIAYEPIWAIGTGKTATASYANKMCSEIKDIFFKKYHFKIKTLYGGSVNPTNITKLLQEKNIDGVLVGKTSLDFNSFEKLFI